ncbi:MAG: hypothetical protein GX257_11360 [Clostridiales bacterium]|nr:hypothetical protein [Clostridiales bacterium]
MEDMVSERELRIYADNWAQDIYDKDNDNGRRKSTKREKEIISNIIYGALLAIRTGADKQSAMDTAEFTGNLFLRNANGYLTFYTPIKECDLL